MEKIQLLSINKGPCEACYTGTWTYRIHIQDEELGLDGDFIQWCERCLEVHSYMTSVVVIDRITKKNLTSNNSERSHQ